MLLDRSVLEEELLVVFKILNAPSTFNKCYRNAALQRKGIKFATFNLTAARKCSLIYRKAARKCPKAIGKPLDNS
jgi:hypothetical protein